jgi:hypothetical protein
MRDWSSAKIRDGQRSGKARRLRSRSARVGTRLATRSNLFRTGREAVGVGRGVSAEIPGLLHPHKLRLWALPRAGSRVPGSTSRGRRTSLGGLRSRRCADRACALRSAQSARSAITLRTRDPTVSRRWEITASIDDSDPDESSRKRDRARRSSMAMARLFPDSEASASLTVCSPAPRSARRTSRATRAPPPQLERRAAIERRAVIAYAADYSQHARHN